MTGNSISYKLNTKSYNSNLTDPDFSLFDFSRLSPLNLTNSLVVAGSLHARSLSDFAVVVKRSEVGVLVEEDVALNPPRKPCTDLVLCERAGWDREGVVELFESALGGLGAAEEDADPGQEASAGEEAEGTGRAQLREHRGEEQTEHGTDRVVDGDTETDTDCIVSEQLSMKAATHLHGASGRRLPKRRRTARDRYQESRRQSIVCQHTLYCFSVSTYV